MQSNTRTTCLDSRLLRGFEGSMVTTYELVSDSASPQSTSATVSRKWIIIKKLTERASPLSDHGVKLGRGSSMTVGKFLCRSAVDPNQTAYMRIYHQIPITGTEDADYNTLASQAVPPKVCGELECFKLLQSEGCNAAPRFLGHADTIQGDNDLVPGGFIRYIVWENVPGESLTNEFFWGLEITARNNIRAKFRNAYCQLLSCGIESDEARISKIIFDQSTDNLHISGFRIGWPILGKLEWSDINYVAFGLAKRGKEADWYLHPETWEW